MTKATKGSTLVYSSELGRICPGCEQPVAKCACKARKPSAAGDGIIRVGRETKGRGGKTVTTVSGIPLDGEGIKNLASELKRRCGTGGTIKEGILEIQGDHRDLLVDELLKKGYKAKKAGG